MKINKKTYVSPIAGEIYMTPGTLLVVSGLTDGDDDLAEGDGSDQLAGDYRSDWDNIWQDM